MSSAAVPAWKQAIYDRKKQQQREEELKAAEEEAYLASLPPWKRSLFLKKKKEAGEAGTNKQPAASSTSKPSAKQAAAPAGPRSPHKSNDSSQTSNGPSRASAATVQPGKVQDSVTRQTPVPAASSTSPTQTAVTSSMPTDNVPLWKKNAQKQTETKKPLANGTTHTAAPTPKAADQQPTKPAVKLPFDEYDDERLAKLPTWKRDLILRKRAAALKELQEQEKMAPVHAPTPTKVNRKESLEKDHNWQQQVDTSSPNKLPVKKGLGRKISSDKLAMWSKSNDTAKASTEKEASKPVSPLPAVAQQPDESVSSSAIEQSSNDNMSQETSDKPTAQSTKEQDSSNPVSPPILGEVKQWVNVTEEDSQFKALPAWKQALIMRRRNDIRRRSNPDDADIMEAAAKVKESQADGDDETDMPEWKKEMMEKKDKKMEQQRQEHSAAENEIWAIDPDMPEWKKEAIMKKMKEKKQHRAGFQDRKSTSLPVLTKVKPKPMSSSNDIPEWKKEALAAKQNRDEVPEWKKEALAAKQNRDEVPEWKKEAAKQNKDKIPEWKKEAMAAKQNRNEVPEWKKQHARGSSTTDDDDDESGGIVLTGIRHLSSTDEPSEAVADEDDDIPCTSIDDLSSDDSEVGTSGSYDVNPTGTRLGSASSGYGSDSGMRRSMSSKSILITQRKHSNRKRRVSWDDTNMRKEHSYPKYDYYDYDELNEAEEDRQRLDDHVFSHPIHPSLVGGGNSNSGGLSAYQPTMMSSYSVTASSSSYDRKNPKQPVAQDTPLVEEPEINMSNLSEDVAALLF